MELWSLLAQAVVRIGLSPTGDRIVRAIASPRFSAIGATGARRVEAGAVP